VIPIAKTFIGPDEQAAVVEVLASGMVAAGKPVRAFEAAFAELCQSPTAAACSSGTSGLCVAMTALELPPGSKVLTTPFSFIATANCILGAGCRPVFADVDAATFMLTADGVREALARSPEIRAVLPVHLYGQACEIHEIVEICRARNVFVVEDCAQAHGASEAGVPVGAVGDLGVFSFYATKNMTTGEGGMITGRNAPLLERCKLIIDQGQPARYLHTVLGYNHRMTNIAAVIGLRQLRDLPAWNDMRRRNARALSAGLADVPWLSVPLERPDCAHVYHQYVLTVRDRERLQEHLREAGVGTAVHYPRLITDQPLYQDLGYTSDGLPVATELAARVLSLPVHPFVTEADVRTIVQAVRAFTPAEEAVGVRGN
jgi:perosamine synthetase